MAGARIVLLIEGTNDFRKLARELREAGNTKLTRRLRTKMARAGRGMQDEARRNVMAITSNSTRGGGTAERARFMAGRTGRLTERAQTRIREHSGLRAATAAATKVETKFTGRDVGVRLRTSLRMMPTNQRKLPVHLNTGKWRHPVRADPRKTRADWAWVTQTVTPAGYFTRATRKAPEVREAAAQAVTETIAELAKG